jgi:type IV pilus assembly protein PilY1
VGSRYCSSLGYTYDSVNIARLKSSNKWVALVSSGYFPRDGQDPASYAAEAARTSLLVIDLETGTLIREIRTSTALQTATASFGLSQAIVYDDASDLVDDTAFAGDLAGNLWRFDLRDANPANWKVDLMFRSYGNGGTTNPGEQPIASAPITMTDRSQNIPMVIFGTGKFIGTADRTAAIPIQAHYGIRDYGACDAVDNPTACANYPIRVNQLVTQTMTQDGSAVRRVTTTNPVPATSRGWRIQMNVPSEPGERAFTMPFPFYSSNQVLLRSIIPLDVDPCNPGARYGLMVVNATDGTAFVDPADASPSRIVGGVIASATPPGDPITLRGGGAIVFAGINDPISGAVNAAALAAITDAASRADDIWHRGAWRELLDQM